MIQYTRVYIDPDTSEIVHVYTQDTPILFNPVEGDKNLLALDFEMDTGMDVHLHADDIRKTLKYEDGNLDIDVNGKSDVFKQAVKTEPRVFGIIDKVAPATEAKILIGDLPTEEEQPKQED